METEKDSIIGTESDSDTVQKKDGTSCEVKWTEEEVSKIFLIGTGCTYTSTLIIYVCII